MNSITFAPVRVHTLRLLLCGFIWERTAYVYGVCFLYLNVCVETPPATLNAHISANQREPQHFLSRQKYIGNWNRFVMEYWKWYIFTLDVQPWLAGDVDIMPRGIRELRAQQFQKSTGIPLIFFLMRHRRASLKAYKHKLVHRTNSSRKWHQSHDGIISSAQPQSF